MRTIRKIKSNVRTRNSSRHQYFQEKSKQKFYNFDKIPLRWLDENYQNRFGLRNWTWRTIINGVIAEHLLSIKSDTEPNKEIDQMNEFHINLLWHTLLKTAEIFDLDQVPKLEEPEHSHVKTILIMYSLNCFLFGRLNQGSRE